MMPIDIIFSMFYRKREDGKENATHKSGKCRVRWRDSSTMMSIGIMFPYACRDEKRGCEAEGSPDQGNLGECFSMLRRFFRVRLKEGSLLEADCCTNGCLINSKSHAH